MKFVISFFLIATIYRASSNPLSRSLLYQISAAVFDDELGAYLEDLRPTLKTGNESLGIPCLTPYHKEYYNISSADASTDIKGDISDVKIYGLPDYIVNHAKFRYARLQLKLNLTWPNITLNSLYRINAVIDKWGYLPVYGKGDVKLVATNVTATSTMKMGMKTGKIFVREMEISFHVRDVKFVASGIYNSDGVSEIANAIVSSQLPSLIEHYQRTINIAATPSLMDLINEQLAQLTFEDFLNIIG